MNRTERRAAARQTHTATISAAQLAANRANSKLSSGPTTDQGRAISAQNRTTHGLTRHNGTFVLLPSEDPAAFAALKESLASEHQPITETESILVTAMAESHWLANRAQNLQSTCLDPITGQITDAPLFSLYLRYQTTHARAFHKSLNALLKLRAEKRKTENGFEAQNRKHEEFRLKTERHDMKKEHHYWDVLLKNGKACHQITLNMLQNSKGAAEYPGFEARCAAEFVKQGIVVPFQPGSPVGMNLSAKSVAS